MLQLQPSEPNLISQVVSMSGLTRRGGHHRLPSESTQPIDIHQDYVEFIRLALIILGANVTVVSDDSHVHFSPPEAYHRAIRMVKGIYCLKIYLFREQFKLMVQELKALRRICLFNVTIYVKAWFTAPSSSDALYNDLCLLQTWSHLARLTVK